MTRSPQPRRLSRYKKGGTSLIEFQSSKSNTSQQDEEFTFLNTSQGRGIHIPERVPKDEESLFLYPFPFPPGNYHALQKSVNSPRFARLDSQISLTVKVGQSRPSMIYSQSFSVLQIEHKVPTRIYHIACITLTVYARIYIFPIHSPLISIHTIVHVTHITCQIIHRQHTRHLDTQITTYVVSA